MLKTLQKFLVARGRQSLHAGSNPVPYTQSAEELSKKGEEEYEHKEGGHRNEDGA